MCGIVGIFSHQPVAQELYNSLINLQHRGQDAAGIATCQNRFYTQNGLGLVREIFDGNALASLKGNLGIGHTRYPTAGGNTLADVQPIWIGSPRGIALAHNGNLTNHEELTTELTVNMHRHLDSTTDSEVLLHLISHGLDEASDAKVDDAIYFERLTQVVQNLFNLAKGSFSVVSMIIGKGMLVFRDPHGIRPLVWGQRQNDDNTTDYIFASENTMFHSLGFKPMGDVQHGEVIYINLQGQMFRKIVAQRSLSPCIFEYVYFSRPDATLDDVSVYRARSRMGENLAKKWQKKYPNVVPDVIIPAPFTSNTAALAMANELGVKYSEGLYKNPFIGRTFIMPEGKNRAEQVRYKLSPQRIEIQNKKVLVVDDSIVRGTTSREIVKMIREHDAKEVYFASASPPLKMPCFYGIDIPSRKNLIAAYQSEEEIRQYLNVDYLLYQEIDDLVEAVTRKGKHRIEKPCAACMNGCYVTEDNHNVFKDFVKHTIQNSEEEVV